MKGVTYGPSYISVELEYIIHKYSYERNENETKLQIAFIVKVAYMLYMKVHLFQLFGMV